KSDFKMHQQCVMFFLKVVNILTRRSNGGLIFICLNTKNCKNKIHYRTFIYSKKKYIGINYKQIDDF
ncbi:hypothetical protein, partial [Escherichia coli]|uniref:hypothetical protein n=1 Tax=Escherichia coli TaxID=562 RepID=UPI001BC8650A